MKRQLMAAVAVCALSFTAGCASTTPQPTERYADGGGPATTPLLQAAAAGVTIGAGALSVGSTVVAVAVFSVLAAMTVVIPVLAYHLAADRLREPLAQLKEWLQANNTTVMSVLILVIGVVLFGKGLGGLV